MSGWNIKELLQAAAREAALSPWGDAAPKARRLRPVDVRRAILAVYLRRDGGPLSVTEAARLVSAEEGVEVTAARVSDVLRYQVRAGRAMRLRRGVHRLHVGQYSRSTVWRCLNWRRC